MILSFHENSNYHGQLKFKYEVLYFSKNIKNLRRNVRLVTLIGSEPFLDIRKTSKHCFYGPLDSEEVEISSIFRTDN